MFRIVLTYPPRGLSAMNNAASNVIGGEVQGIVDTLSAVAGDCRNSPELRAELDADPRAFLTSRGLEFPAGADLRVVANTPEVFHLALPPDPNAAVSDRTLSAVAGGSSHTSGQPGCASTVSTLPSCLGTASSVADRPGRF